MDNHTGLTSVELDNFSTFAYFDWSVIFQNIFNGKIIISMYSLIASVWSAILGDNVVVLRLLSVICGAATCIVAYFSCEKPCNYICLALFGINSFLITYSQEVSMYSLLGLFATLSLVSLYKIKSTDKGYILWTLSNVCLVMTSIFSIFFVLLETLLLWFYKKEDKNFFKAIITGFSLLVPYVLYVAFSFGVYANSFIGTDKNFAYLLGFIQNVFSPELINLKFENFVSYYQALYYDINFFSLGYVVIPILVGLYFVYRAFVKDKFNIFIFLIGLGYLIIRVLLQAFLGVPFVAGEYILLVVLLLILMGMGFELDVLSIFLIVLFVISNVSYLILQENSAFKNNKIGVFTITDSINENVSNGDVVIVWNKINDLEANLNKKVKIYDIKQEFVLKTEDELLASKVLKKNMLSKNKKDALRLYFAKKSYSVNSVEKVRILYALAKNGQKIYVVFPNVYTEDFNKFLEIVRNDEKYYNTEYGTLMKMFTIAQVNSLISNIFTLDRKIVKDKFIIMVYKK